MCYKQLNSSVGQFGTDVLVADTAALKTGHERERRALPALLARDQGAGRAQRDALATQIKNDLYNAEFNAVALLGVGTESVRRAARCWRGRERSPRCVTDRLRLTNRSARVPGRAARAPGRGARGSASRATADGVRTERTTDCAVSR